jgi:hypothetical protein
MNHGMWTRAIIRRLILNVPTYSVIKQSSVLLTNMTVRNFLVVLRKCYITGTYRLITEILHINGSENYINVNV